MSPEIIRAASLTDAWVSTVQYLSQFGDGFNLVIDIQEPLNYSEEDLETFDPRKFLRSARSNEDVANTIFPKKSSLWDASNAEFYNHYYPAYKALLRRGPRSWGIYFLRLIDFGQRNINQLARTVDGLTGWGHNHKAAFTIHFSSAETDAPRPLGAPCLQYCEFVREGGRLSLTALYRSHDYYVKALGNFVGLSRLLHYVARKADLEVGSLVCHSTYAYLGSNKRRALDLINEGALR